MTYPAPYSGDAEWVGLEDPPDTSWTRTAHVRDGHPFADGLVVGLLLALLLVVIVGLVALLVSGG